MSERRRFGRAKVVRFARRCANIALDATYNGGWAARLAHRFGLQGSLEVTESTVVLPRYRGTAPLRVAFASDFHAGPTTHPALLDDACHALEASGADLLLFGGDYVCFHPRDVRALANRLACLAAPLGKYAVIGNHDIDASRPDVIAALEEAGVRVLVNASVRLPAPYTGIAVCGLDDPVLGDPDAVATMQGIPEADARVVLLHGPEGLLDLRGTAFDLALAGHTHGGQVALPNGTPIRMPGPPINRRYARGRFTLPEHGGGTLIVSRGIGFSDLPIRLFAHPQVHLLTLLPTGFEDRREPDRGRTDT